MITNGQIHDLTYAEGIPPQVVWFKDGYYECPDYGWLQDVFAEGLEQFRKTQGISQYVPGGNDCDDFSLDTEFYARLTFRKSKPDSQATFACGLFSYRQASGGLHMINVFVCDRDAPRLVYYEPQADRIVQLSKSEIQSCIRFSM
jgi:hypothetical protein